MLLLSFERQAFRKWAQKIVLRTHSDKNPDADAQELLFKRSSRLSFVGPCIDLEGVPRKTIHGRYDHTISSLIRRALGTYQVPEFGDAIAISGPTIRHMTIVDSSLRFLKLNLC